MTKTPASLLARHLARVIDSSDDAIVSKDLDGIIRSWNRAAERIFGYAASEAIGQSIRMIVPPDRLAEEDDVLRKIRAGETISHFETIRQRKDGTSVSISLTVSPIRDDDGRVIGASKIARDISDRKRSDVAVRRLAAVVESSDDAIVTKDLNGIITSWNRAAERMFGYTEAEAVGRSIRMLLPHDLQAEEDAVLARIRAGGVVDHYETQRQAKDGTRLEISLTVSPLRNETGEIVGASKIARNITEAVRLRKLAETQATITRKLHEVGSVLASNLDRTAIVRKVTDVATELTGAEAGAFVFTAADEDAGETYVLHRPSGASQETPGSSPAAHATSLLPAMGSPEMGPLRLHDVTLDLHDGQGAPDFGGPEGHAPVRSYLVVPVVAPRGDVLGGLYFGHSQAGVFTEEGEQLAVGIAAWAAVALENARLYIEAREANRMKDEFLAVLSHELRTPLNAIVGYARLLRGGLLTGDKAQRGLETLDRNAAWLTQIIEDVLDVSRIVSGKFRLDVQPVDLALVIHNAVATVQPAADAKGVRLQTILDSHVGLVAGDRDRLQQVAWNLLSNAVKFTPRGGRVQVRLERINSHVELVVADTGIGMRPEFLPHIFERFSQIDTGTKRKTGGLGLGLAIVRHIVELHGGTVEASSPGEDQGSTFRVRLPTAIVHQASEPGRQHPRTDRLEPLSGLASLRGVRVLAVDDDEDALNLLRSVLETAGAEVTALSSSHAVLEQLPVVRPDVMLLDLGIPEMDGFELIGRIRQLPDAGLRRIPAAALTAFARVEDRTKALRSGFEMHLAKPVDPAELVASVATLVRRVQG